MEKQIYTHDQQLDIVSEIILALEKRVRFAEKNKAKAYMNVARDVFCSVIGNCFYLDDEEGKKLLDESREAAIEKDKRRSLDILNELPGTSGASYQEMVDDGASVSIIAEHDFKEEGEDFPC